VLAASTTFVGSEMDTAKATGLRGATDNDTDSVKTPLGPVTKPLLLSASTFKVSKSLDGE